MMYSWHMNSTGLNCKVLLICVLFFFFSINAGCISKYEFIFHVLFSCLMCSFHNTYNIYSVLCKTIEGTSLMVQWLRLQAPNAEGHPCSILDQGPGSYMLQLKKMLHARTKHPTCSRDQRLCLPQLRPSAVK